MKQTKEEDITFAEIFVFVAQDQKTSFVDQLWGIGRYVWATPVIYREKEQKFSLMHKLATRCQTNFYFFHFSNPADALYRKKKQGT